MMTDIVLTGTIMPQSNFVGVADYATRRREYLRCLNYYSSFGNVYFLENSKYDVEADPAFHITNVKIVKFRETDGDAFTLGKGYQEFKMLDQFVLDEKCPARFFKVTGRRFIPNFAEFLTNGDGSGEAVFDLVRRHRIADTSFFFCSKRFYLEHIAGAYKAVNDDKGAWIERVLYARFHERATTQLFAVTPLFEGQSGSTGSTLKYPLWKQIIRKFQRRVWPVFGMREL
jgi:hypothetical protein